MSDSNLNDYETVKARKQRFYQKYPDGRIIVTPISIDEKGCVFQCKVYKNLEEQKLDMPISTGYAQEFKGQGGFANKFSWCENCEESAVGRALDNASFSNGMCSREEMVKVQEHEREVEVEISKVSKPKLTPKQVQAPKAQASADAHNNINNLIVKMMKDMTDNLKDLEKVNYIKSEILGIKEGHELVKKEYGEKEKMVIGLKEYAKRTSNVHRPEELPF